MSGKSTYLQRLHALILAIVAVLLLMASIRLAGWLFADMLTRGFGGGEHGTALARLSASAIGEAVFVTALFLVFHNRKQPPLEPRIFAPGNLRGWLIAIAFTGLWVSSIAVYGPLQSQPLLELSSFNVLGSIIAGFGAGTFEEVLFRGVLMCFLARYGFRTWAQVLTSALLFGFAHVGWGVIGGTVEVPAMASAMIATTILGLAQGLIFVAAGRSLIPAIATHATINLAIEPWLVLTLLVARP